jgi:hypothetical protein
MIKKTIIAALLFFTVTSLIIVFPVSSEINTERVVVVDQNLTIVKIINYSKNKKNDPVIILEGAAGVELPLTESIKNQYLKLEKKLNFKKNGVIYEKKDTGNLSIFSLLIGLLKEIVGAD